MTTTNDIKKIVQDQNNQTYNGDEPTGESSDSPLDIDALAQEVLGNIIPENQPLDIAGQIEEDEKNRYGPPENLDLNGTQEIIDPTDIQVNKK